MMIRVISTSIYMLLNIKMKNIRDHDHWMVCSVIMTLKIDKYNHYHENERV
jgi:hypothetical protein